MGGKKATSQRIAQFRSDAGLLLKALQLNELAEKLGLKDASYLGRCINGNKDPGSKFLDRFYAALESDLARLKDAAASTGKKTFADSSSEQESFKTEEPSQAYGTIEQDYIQTLKGNNLDLRANLGVVIKNNETVIKNNETVIKNNEVLVLNNQKLVDELIARLNQPNK